MRYESYWQRRIKSLIPTVVGTLLMLYLLFHIFQGDRGLLTQNAREREMQTVQAQLDSLEQEQARLKHAVGLLRRDNLDLDMLEERARAMINFTRSDEVVIFYQDE